MVGNAVADKERTLAVFRNARPDNESLNDTETYLHGVTGEVEGLAYWSGIKGERHVILRKISQAGVSGVGAVFTVYRGTVTTGVAATGKVNGTSVSLENLPAQANGVFFIGDLPYGVYTAAETQLPTGVTGTIPVYFDIIVDESGVSCVRRG